MVDDGRGVFGHGVRVRAAVRAFGLPRTARHSEPCSRLSHAVMWAPVVAPSAYASCPMLRHSTSSKVCSIRSPHESTLVTFGTSRALSRSAWRKTTIHRDGARPFKLAASRSGAYRVAFGAPGWWTRRPSRRSCSSALSSSPSHRASKP